MSSWTTQEVQAAIEEVYRRSVTDPDFRALALRDAKAAFAKIDPRPLPPGLAPQFVENSGPVQTLVLPDPIEGIEELSEDALEQVAGGWDVGVQVRGGGPRPAPKPAGT